MGSLLPGTGLMAHIRATTKVADKLAALSKATERTPSVKVGFLEGARYPDGTSVAMVATVNEFGAPSRGQPPRPFFRNMVTAKRDTWGDALAKQMTATDDNVAVALDRMGQGIKGQLQQSIRDLTEPPLAASTVRAKGFSKPLIDTSVMLKSVDYEVEGL